LVIGKHGYRSTAYGRGFGASSGLDHLCETHGNPRPDYPIPSTIILFYGFIVLHLAIMKTTIDLPPSLLKQAKHKAIENNTTFKALVISGLKKEIASPAKTASDPIEQLRDAGAQLWRGIKADHYVRELRKNWK